MRVFSSKITLDGDFQRDLTQKFSNLFVQGELNMAEGFRLNSPGQEITIEPYIRNMSNSRYFIRGAVDKHVGRWLYLQLLSLGCTCVYKGRPRSKNSHDDCEDYTPRDVLEEEYDEIPPEFEDDTFGESGRSNGRADYSFHGDDIDNYWNEPGRFESETLPY